MVAPSNPRTSGRPRSNMSRRPPFPTTSPPYDAHRAAPAHAQLGIALVEIGRIDDAVDLSRRSGTSAAILSVALFHLGAL